MDKRKLVILAGIGVTGVAIAKTGLTSAVLLQGQAPGLVPLLLMFVTYWGLTGAVALAVYYVVRNIAGQRRTRRIAATLTEEPGKENLVESHGRVWGLTPSETEVALLVVKGFSNAEIAGMRNCALPTVKSQLTSIYHKSGLQSRYQLIAFITDEVCEMSRDGAARDGASGPLTGTGKPSSAAVVPFGARASKAAGKPATADASPPKSRLLSATRQ